MVTLRWVIIIIVFKTRAFSSKVPTDANEISLTCSVGRAGRDPIRLEIDRCRRGSWTPAPASYARRRWEDYTAYTSAIARACAQVAVNQSYTGVLVLWYPEHRFRSSYRVGQIYLRRSIAAHYNNITLIRDAVSASPRYTYNYNIVLRWSIRLSATVRH